MFVHIVLSSSKGSGKSALILRLTGALAAYSHTQSMDVDKRRLLVYAYEYQVFSYHSEVRARGLVNLGKKHLDHQNWENLMQSKRTGLPFVL